MRGRTNIPPRMGGIVNGVVREYQVAEEGGIKAGDYVEIAASNSSHVRGLMSSSEYDFGNDIKEECGAGSYSSRLIELSDGKCCMFYFPSSSSNVAVIAQLFQEVNGVFVEEQIELTDVVGRYARTQASFACEIAKDKILLLLAPYRAEYASGYILEYNNSQFNATKLTLESSLGDIYSMDGSKEKGMYKWSNDLYVIPTDSNKSITICRLDESNNTFTFVSNLVLDTSDSNIQIQILGKYNGYLVVLVDNKVLYTISISGDGVATVVSSGTVPSITYDLGSQYIKLNDDTLFYVYGLFDVSYAANQQIDFTVYITVIRILVNGSVSVSTKYSKKYIDCLYQRVQGGYKSLEYSSMFYHNGILFGLVSGVSSPSHDSNSKLSDGLKDLFSLPVEISVDGTVVFGDISVQHLGYRDSSSASSKMYNICGRGAIREDGTVYILTQEALASGKPVYRIKPSKEGIVNLHEADLMKKYATKISGIAKTSGAKGEIIEVYSPE